MIVFLYVCSTISKPRRLFHVIVFSFLIKQSIHQIYTYITNAIPHDLFLHTFYYFQTWRHSLSCSNGNTSRIDKIIYYGRILAFNLIKFIFYFCWYLKFWCFYLITNNFSRFWTKLIYFTFFLEKSFFKNLPQEKRFTNSLEVSQFVIASKF